MAGEPDNGGGVATAPMPPIGPPGEASAARAALGELLKTKVDDVLSRTVEQGVGHEFDEVLLDRFERIGRSSTIAVARWISGESMEVAIEAGRETWEIFGELAVHRVATLDQVTWCCFWWRNAMTAVLAECVAGLDTDPADHAQALAILQLSLEFSLLRMCECFEEERRRTDGELSRREEQLAFLATHDALTGLPNRALIMDRTEQTLARARRSGAPAAALFIDLDNFKDINDTLGHRAGDQLLQAVASRLGGVVRESDALGRLGGDEFVVISEELSLAAGPELVAERLLDALSHPFQLGDEQTQVTVTASVGIAIAEGPDAEELLRNADIAMYRAKWDGRNRYAVFEAGMQETVQRRVELESDLRVAVEREEFFLTYQPTIDLRTMVPTGVEALIRWAHPERGVVEPETFVPVLEETGMIVDVGRWVLREAAIQGAAWRRSGFPLNIAVNVSVRQLESEAVVPDVEAALATSGLEAAALTVEITETALMREHDEVATRLAAIKELGVQIAIDDFGTGYSSLSHLQKFPVDALKIDRSFITGLHGDREGEALIQTLLQLGRALSIETFAEGIEAEDELSLLRRERCDIGQGFLFSRPLEAAATEEFLRAWTEDPAEALRRV